MKAALLNSPAIFFFLIKHIIFFHIFVENLATNLNVSFVFIFVDLDH